MSAAVLLFGFAAGVVGAFLRGWVRGARRPCPSCPEWIAKLGDTERELGLVLARQTPTIELAAVAGERS